MSCGHHRWSRARGPCACRWRAEPCRPCAPPPGCDFRHATPGVRQFPLLRPGPTKLLTGSVRRSGHDPKGATVADSLFDPNSYDPKHLDEESRRLLRATIDWFENRGKRQLTEDDQERVWYTEFLD